METADVDQFDSSSCCDCIYYVYAGLCVWSSFCHIFRKKIKESVKKWGTSDFSWGLVTFQIYSSPRPVEKLA